MLRALVNLDPYTFAADFAEDIAGDNENEQRSAEEVLLSTIDATADDKLTRFALRLALAERLAFRAKASSTSSPKPKPHLFHHSQNKAATRKAKQPTPIESSATVTPKSKVQNSTSARRLPRD